MSWMYVCMYVCMYVYTYIYIYIYITRFCEHHNFELVEEGSQIFWTILSQIFGLLAQIFGKEISKKIWPPSSRSKTVWFSQNLVFFSQRSLDQGFQKNLGAWAWREHRLGWRGPNLRKGRAKRRRRRRRKRIVPKNALFAM